jgi:hypothetical protein
MKRMTKIASAVATASLVAALGAGVAFAQGSNGAESIARICNGSAACATSQTCVGGNGACAGSSCGYTDEDGNGFCDNYEACPAANGAGSGNAGGACYGYGNGDGCGQGAGNGACNGSAARAGWGYSR